MIDAQNDKVTLRVNVDGRVEVTNALVQSAGVAAFNADQIKFIAIVVDDPNATTGTVNISTKDLSFVPVISATTTNALTNLTGASISSMAPAGVNTVTGFSQTGTGTASFTYNLANGTGNNRWAGSLISLSGNFDLTTKNLVIDASDAGSTYYKL